jgi:pimeloyl-ACP methyl ester carboxylesterase/GNAT superfamily N-acetyltransferase
VDHRRGRRREPAEVTAPGRRGAERILVRRAGPEDADAIGDVWLTSWRATFEFPPAHPDADVRRWLAEELLPKSEVWVAVDPDDGGRVVGFMALSASMVEQLYLVPDWIGRGVGDRLITLSKGRRPDGLDLYCFQVNAFARRFYERRGFVPIAFGDGSNNEEHQPDIRYAWRPKAAQSRTVTSADGTRIGVFTSGTGLPLVLVHGASADHTTFRVVGPVFGERFTVHAIDRRGRGASGDTPPYSIEREFEDMAAVASAIARESGGPVDVVGHSYGGRCALGAALLTDDIRRVVSYEGAPAPPNERYGDAEVLTELRALDEAGDPAGVLSTFMRRVVGMDEEALARYRLDPVWPVRVAAAHTIVRELESEAASPAAGLEALGRVRQPVLQILGGDSRPEFATATRALGARLADGRIFVIEGARHAAHHTHPEVFVEAVAKFLAEP